MIRTNYVFWALVACLSYSFVPPLVRVATREIPSTVAALISNIILVSLILLVLALTDEDVVHHLRTDSAIYLYVAGLFLGVGILAYYRALEFGPVSIVVPLFAMFIVGGSVIGVLVLDESMTVRNGFGIVLAVAAIYLLST
ncbi:EamA family transporter [Natrinema versiforme]|uniref:Multidrug transporter n=1 Tax=Natrinema versiforme TaxID=88724 RepID=A0A4P8WNA8_9EURY|nr:EamA family transporter [Natrinema versiforme]QCS44855.1 multidrug transporter [Natrinema versiforme]